MKKKLVITLLFSLFTVAICSNLKAAEQTPKRSLFKRGTQKAALRVQLADTEGALADTKGTLKDTKGTLKDTKGALADAKEALADAKEALADAKEELNEVTTDFDQYKQNSNNLEQERDSSAKEIQDLQTQIDDSELKFSSSQDNVKKFELMASQFKTQMNGFKDDAGTWEEKHNALQTEAKDMRKQFVDSSTRLISLEKANKGLQQEENTWKEKNNALQKEAEDMKKQFVDSSRCKPYIGGLALAEGAETLLSYIKSEEGILNLLHLATKDSRKLQSISLLATSHDGSHTFLNRYSTQGIDEKNGMLIVPGRNVGAEVVSSLGLRYIWNRFIAKRMKSNNDNIVVRNARKLPKPIKTVFKPIKVFIQDLACLAIIRTCALGLHGKHPFQETK